MSDFKFETENFILYILQKMGSKSCDKIKLNKIAFFVEFGYYFKKQKELSKTKYAGISYGPVIDNYANIFAKMNRDGLLKLEGNKIVVTQLISYNVPKEVLQIINPLIAKYSKLSVSELVSLSHQTDSYKITTENEKVMGKIIDKKLAALETFFADNLVEDDFDEDLLPKVDAKKLKAYDLGGKL